MNHAFASAGMHANKFGKEASRTRRIAGAAFKVMGAGALVGGALVAKGLKDSIKAAMDSQQVQAQTLAALKSTGNQAGVTARHINNLANKISQFTGIDDEAVQSTENLLLTFTKIKNVAGSGNNIFDQATLAIQDMSVALKQDASKSAIKLGKALNDPVKGVSSLRRAGVAFDKAQTTFIKLLVEGGKASEALGYTNKVLTIPQIEALTKAEKAHLPAMAALKAAHITLNTEQMKMVKHLTEGGHNLEAQKMILKELKTEFGGSAKAAGKTFGGQLNLLRVNVENLEERIGNLLLPVLTRWARNINRWLGQARNQRKVIHDIRVAVRIMVGAFRIAAKTVAAFIDVGRLLVRWYRVFMRVNARVEGAFKSVWVSMKKQVMSFYVWIQKMGFKVALALVEPFSHLPKRLGGGTFQKIKRDLQKQLNDIEGVGEVQAKRNKRGQVRSPIVGGIAAAGGRLRAPGPPAAPERGGGRGPRSQEVTVHNHIHIDGKEVEHTVTKRQQKKRRRDVAQRGGRHPGASLA